MAQNIPNSKKATEEENLINEYELDLRICSESGIYKNEKIDISNTLNKIAQNNQIENPDKLKETHNGKGTI